MRMRLRVLWLIKGLGPGGAERLLLSAAHVRDRAAFDYEVAYLLPWKHHLVPSLEQAGVPVHCLDAPQPADLRWAGRLRRLLLRSRYDVVHAHSPIVAAVARPVVRSLPESVRPKLVSTEHNGWPRYGRATRLLNRWTSGMDDARFAVSEQVRDSIPPHLRRRVEVLVHGVEVEAIRSHLARRSAVRDEFGVPSGRTLIGTVANLTHQKAYPDLMAAAALVPDAHFLAVGQGPLEAQLRALHAESGLGERFRLLGYREDAVRVLAGCDVFVLASRYEGFPVALMEALALGLPVVATAVGGVPDGVRQGVEGVLVPPAAPQELARALNELIADPQRRRRMGAAAEHRGRDFDIRVPVAYLEDTYRRLTGVAARSTV
jgi:glycosyltransferase involved in cell wall biosynthesis